MLGIVKEMVVVVAATATIINVFICDNYKQKRYDFIFMYLFRF